MRHMDPEMKIKVCPDCGSDRIKRMFSRTRESDLEDVYEGRTEIDMSLRKKRPVRKKKKLQKGCYNCGNRVNIGGGQSVCRVYYPMVVIIHGRHAKEYNYCRRECWVEPEVE